MSRPPSGTVTFLFSDIEGSTRRWERDETAMAVALAQHDRLLRGSIERHGGFIFKTVGDAFCAAFPAPAAAVAAAVAAQRALRAASWPAPGPLAVRMALHAGAAEARDGDYFGPALNACARLLGVAHGGQILGTAAVVELAGVDPGPDLGWRDLGEHRLRDLGRAVHIFQLIAADLPADFPPPASLESYRHNLPSQLTSFVGREREIADVLHALAEARLLTLTGVGGTGKSRLALQVAAQMVVDYPDGVWYVDVAPLVDAPRLAQAIASAAGVREQPGRSLLDALVEALRRRRLMLVLDNCEHQLAACADLVAALVRQAPEVRILVTSRAPLGLAGERQMAMPTMIRPAPGPHPSTPAGLATLGACESVRLFVERAQAVRPSFALTPANAAAVAEVCRGLDGIPLAIELAAARVAVLPVPQIAERLDQRFGLLTGGHRGALPHQQTLRATMDWSWELLQPDGRSLLQRLSVFAGGWTLEAAEAVGSGGGLVAGRMLDGLAGLVASSLVLAEDLEGRGRYRLLSTVRLYAAEKLAAARQTARLRRRHAAFFRELALRAEPELNGQDQSAWLDQLDRDHDNLDAALTWYRERGDVAGGLSMATALYRFWLTRTYWSEGPRALDRPAGPAGGGGPTRAAGQGPLQRRRVGPPPGRLRCGAVIERGGAGCIPRAGRSGRHRRRPEPAGHRGPAPGPRPGCRPVAFRGGPGAAAPARRPARRGRGAVQPGLHRQRLRQRPGGSSEPVG